MKIPKVLPINPVTLVCPFCKAKPGYDCLTTAKGYAALHLQRIAAAAATDVSDKHKREAAARIVRKGTKG